MILSVASAIEAPLFIPAGWAYDHFGRKPVIIPGTVIVAAAWAALASWCFLFASVGSAMTIYIGPGANGSGIADLMAYINGINYVGCICWSSLWIKIICVVMGISGALCIGKEGPLAHIGACVAVAVIYSFPIKQFKYF